MRPNRATLASALLFALAGATAQAQRIPVTLNEGTNLAAALSPDGSEIVLDLQGTLWLRPVSEGESIQLTDGLGDDRQPAWSPDGNSIVFQSYRDGNWNIWKIDRDGDGLVQLTEGPADHREPHFSPDGGAVVFSSDLSGNYDLWTFDLERGRATQITDEPANDYAPAYSPDGSRIAFVSEREPGGIYVQPAGGGQRPRLVARVDGSSAGPAWNPAGDTLSFQNFRRAEGVTELLTVGLEGGTAVRISAPGEDVFPFRGHWSSPSEIVYTADGHIRRARLGGAATDIPFEVTVGLDRGFYPHRARDLDSARPRPVLGIRSPAVSPDGERVVFVALGDIWIREPGGALTRVTDDAFIEAHPRWSPEGTALVFVSDREGRMQLWVHDLSSGAARRLAGASGAAYPVFSPDGTRGAYFGSEGASLLGARLSVMHLGSGLITTPLDRQVPATEISWASSEDVALTALGPESTRFREGAYEVLAVPAAGGSPRRLSFARPDSLSHASFSPNGRKLAFVADGVFSVAEVGRETTIQADLEPLVDELIDWPTWAGDSRTLVYVTNGELKKVDSETRETEALPIEFSWVPQQNPGRTVVHAGRMFDGKTGGYRTDMDIVIVDGRIERVAPHSEGAHGENWIDAGEHAVLPGLVEMHAHQGVAPESQGRAWLSFGVTSVRGPGEDAYDALERKEAWAAGRRIGPRQFYAGRLLDGRRVYYTLAEGTHTLAHLANALERAQTLEYDMIKTYVRLPDEVQRRVAAVAHDIGIPVSSHEIYPSTANGVDAVEHLGGTSRRGYSPKITGLGRSYSDVVTLLAASGMNITPTAVLPCYPLHVSENPDLLANRQYQWFYGASGRPGLPPRLRGGSLAGRCESMGRTIKAIVDAGGRATVGTDSPFVPYGFGLHVEMQLFERAGLEPWQVLRSATSWSAEAIGVGDQLGSIEAGKIADMVIVDGDPLARVADALNVTATLKGGRLYSLEELLSSP
ncbi:MAG: LpqB family beta-propeller domain-containing protein [Acidobacteriota bacterium]|nr:LpqB family beta-propeller domain-containing protein [Acidobacteriota bacterium]